MTAVLRTPKEWQVLTGITIMDPDGWRGINSSRSFDDPISEEEWNQRMAVSTIMMQHVEVMPYERMTRKELIACLEAQDAHHAEHHAREADMTANGVQKKVQKLLSPNEIGLG